MVDGQSRPALVAVPDGEWAGWHHYEPADRFEDHTGPFYTRPDGPEMVCGFRPGPDNANGGGFVHGGALMTFADYALFMIAGGMDMAVHGVTVTCNCEFTGAAEVGRLLVARGEVVRAGGSLIFLRGLVSDEQRPILAFSGTIKRLRKT